MIEWWKNYYNRYLLNEFSVLTKIGTGLPIFEVRDRDRFWFPASHSEQVT